MERVYIKSLAGSCPSSSYVAGSFESFFSKNGFELTSCEEQADIIVVNGCNVVSGNDASALEYTDIAQSHPEKNILMVGCTPSLSKPENAPSNFYFIPYRRMLAKPTEIEKIFNALEPFKFDPADSMMPENGMIWWSQHVLDMNSMCYIRIADGCRDNCSFCAIKSAKGSILSVPLAEILKEFEQGLLRGKKKFWLFGDDVAVWGRDRGLDLGDLLSTLLHRDASARLHLYEGNIRYITDILGKIEPYLPSIDFLMAPIQSGSNRILSLMMRNHRIEPSLETVRRIKKISPGTILSTTVIVGFPGETRDEFRSSLAAAAEFDSTFFLTYQRKQGTLAAHLPDQISNDEIFFRMKMVVKSQKRLNTHAVFNEDSSQRNVSWVRKSLSDARVGMWSGKPK